MKRAHNWMKRAHNQMNRAHYQMKRAYNRMTRAHNQIKRAHNQMKAGHIRIKRAHNQMKRAHNLISDLKWLPDFHYRFSDLNFYAFEWLRWLGLGTHLFLGQRIYFGSLIESPGMSDLLYHLICFCFCFKHNIVFVILRKCGKFC